MLMFCSPWPQLSALKDLHTYTLKGLRNSEFCLWLRTHNGDSLCHAQGQWPSSPSHVYLWTAGHPFPNSVLTPLSPKHLLNSGLSVLLCYSMYKSAGLCPSYSIVSLRIHLLPLLTHHRFKSRSEGHPVSNLTPKLSDKWPYANLSNTP